MNNNINLLKGSKTKRFREEKTIRLFQIISIFSLLIVGGVSVVFFFLQRNVPVAAVEKEEASQKKILFQYSDTAAKLITTKNRIKDIGSIINKRKLLDTVLGDIGQAVPINTKVSSLSLDGKNFSLTVSSPSLSSLDIIVNTLVSMVENKKIFSKVTLVGLSIDPKEGNYIVSLSGNLP